MDPINDFLKTLNMNLPPAPMQIPGDPFGPYATQLRGHSQGAFMRGMILGLLGVEPDKSPDVEFNIPTAEGPDKE